MTKIKFGNQWLLSVKTNCVKHTHTHTHTHTYIYVLNNNDEVQPSIKEHIDYIRHINPVRVRREKWVADEHNKSFIN